MSTTTDSTTLEQEIRAEGIDLAAVEENRPGVDPDPKPAWWPEWLKKLADDVGPWHPKVTHAAACLFYTPQSSPSKSTTPPTTVKPPKDYQGLNGLKTQEFFGRGVGSRGVRILKTEEEIRQTQHDKLESAVNSALHFLNTSVQEHQAKVAVEEQNKHIDKAIAAREAAVKAKREAEKHLDLLLQQRDRAETGLAVADKRCQGTDWHKLDPTIKRARAELKRSVVTVLSCVITAQERLLKYTNEIKNFDQILFQLGASSCSLCGHHLHGNGFAWEEETFDSSIIIGGGDNTCPIICDASEDSGSSSSFGTGESGSCRGESSSAGSSQNSAIPIDCGSDIDPDDPKGKRPAEDNFDGRCKHARC